MVGRYTNTYYNSIGSLSGQEQLCTINQFFFVLFAVVVVAVAVLRKEFASLFRHQITASSGSAI